MIGNITVQNKQIVLTVSFSSTYGTVNSVVRVCNMENTNIITAEYGVVYYAVGEGDLYQVHCDMLFTPASTNEVDNLDQYRIYAIEKFQDGLAVPPPPAK
jgi:hypothetical protein